jgi:DNA polymerase
MGIGEAFGANEQRYGKPFIGRSGKLLDLLLLESGILPEKDIYITNVVKDRPVEKDKDRKPFFDEIKACEEYILKEIEILNPKLIITFGKTSGDWFNNYDPYDINHFYKEKKWLPLYHPSYLLRSRSEIPKFVEAIKNTLREIE